jgi:hypothetical protein
MTLERLKELQAAATPGPWDRDGLYNVLRIAKKSLDWELVNPTEDTSMPDEDDAEFIVVLYEALPALIEVAEAAWKALFVESKQMQDWTEEDIALYAALSQVMLDEGEAAHED